MKIQQLSLFLENRPGHLCAICRILAEANINIITLTVADTREFGIVRLIVRDWRRGREALQRAGFAVNVREVVAALVPDRPGGLAEILECVHRAGVNVEYMYAFAFHRHGKAVLVFRFDDADKAIVALKAAGQEVLADNDVLA